MHSFYSLEIAIKVNRSFDIHTMHQPNERFGQMDTFAPILLLLSSKHLMVQRGNKPLIVQTPWQISLDAEKCCQNDESEDK